MLDRNSVAFGFTAKSGNTKTGRITIVDSRGTCPKSCPLKGSGCYGENFRCKHYWSNLNLDLPLLLLNLKYRAHLSRVARLNVVGDIAISEKSNHIDLRRTLQIVDALKGNGVKVIYTYTHCTPFPRNLHKVDILRENGLQVSFSCHSLEKCIQLSEAGYDSVCLVPDSFESCTIRGVNFVLCPNLLDGVQCANCLKCAVHDPSTVICFKPHGNRKKDVKVAKF